MSESAPKARRGITIFRAEQAAPLLDTDFMGMPQMTEQAQAARGPEIFMGSAAGGDVRVSIRQTPEQGGFSILHVWFKADYPVPRHSHDADCLYYIVSGSAVMGNQV